MQTQLPGSKQEVKMDTIEETMKRELQLLFHALCDGLRQEVRQRSLASLATGQDFSLTAEREVGIASSLALHLRSVGFTVQLDAYFPGVDPKIRPDFGIWLPASKDYIYLEFKLVAWGKGWQYSYKPVIRDIEKLDKYTNQQNQCNGLIALGFSKPEEKPDQLVKGFEKLSEDIVAYPYEKIQLRKVHLQGMDNKSPYAVIGMWFRSYLK